MSTQVDLRNAYWFAEKAESALLARIADHESALRIAEEFNDWAEYVYQVDVLHNLMDNLAGVQHSLFCLSEKLTATYDRPVAGIVSRLAHFVLALV